MKFYKYLLGPEVVWISSIFVAKYISKINATGRLNDFIDTASIGVSLLIFIIIWLMCRHENGDIPFFRTRLILSAILLGHFFASAWAKAYTPQGPGTGIIYLIILGEAIFFSLIYVFILSIKKL